MLQCFIYQMLANISRTVLNWIHQQGALIFNYYKLWVYTKQRCSNLTRTTHAKYKCLKWCVSCKIKLTWQRNVHGLTRALAIFTINRQRTFSKWPKLQNPKLFYRVNYLKNYSDWNSYEAKLTKYRRWYKSAANELQRQSESMTTQKKYSAPNIQFCQIALRVILPANCISSLSTEATSW